RGAGRARPPDPGSRPPLPREGPSPRNLLERSFKFNGEASAATCPSNDIAQPTRQSYAVALVEVLDAAPERIGRTNLPRVGRDHEVVGTRGREVDRAGQRVAVDDERQALPGEDVGP